MDVMEQITPSVMDQPASMSVVSPVPNYSYVFRFEEEFDSLKIKPYIDEFWHVPCFYCSGK
jgi:hypothetical protein